MTRYGIDNGHRYSSAGRGSSSSRRGTRVSSSSQSQSESEFQSQPSSRSVTNRREAVGRQVTSRQEPVGEWPAMPPSNVYDFETAKRIYDQHPARPASRPAVSRTGWAVSQENWVDDLPLEKPVPDRLRGMASEASAPSYGNRAASGAPRGGYDARGGFDTRGGYDARGSYDAPRSARPAASRYDDASDFRNPYDASRGGSDFDSRGGGRGSSRSVGGTASWSASGAASRSGNGNASRSVNRPSARNAANAIGAAYRREDPRSRRLDEDERLQDSDSPENARSRRESEPQGLRAKLEKRRRESRHKRADREFESHVPKDRTEGAEEPQAPRAGVYKGEMGRNQKRAQRMQGASAGFSLPFGLPSFSVGALASHPRLMSAGIVTLCLVLSVLFVYPSAQDYYLTIRTNAQMEAELQAINERNDEISQRIELLSTDEGVEDKLRTEYGWVSRGENAVSVSRDGSAEIKSSASEKSANVVSGSVPAPDTWYSGFLDVFFGYENPTAEVASADEGSEGQEDADSSDSPESGDSGNSDNAVGDGTA
ncbi:MAG: septum formation initiator family protein [Eggerthellales bacterium]|nr:septum formation initiator family protein [Eggerthellales bacterium]